MNREGEGVEGGNSTVRGGDVEIREVRGIPVAGRGRGNWAAWSVAVTSCGEFPAGAGFNQGSGDGGGSFRGAGQAGCFRQMSRWIPAVAEWLVLLLAGGGDLRLLGREVCGWPRFQPVGVCVPGLFRRGHPGSRASSR